MSSASPIYVKRLDEKAVIPTRAHATDAGYDLASIEDVYVSFGPSVTIRTGIAVAIPPGHYGRIAERSGNASRHGLCVGGGVVDSGYRGEICVILYTHVPDKVVHITPGMLIAQLIIERIATPHVVVVDELDDTDRGTSGFGSTGVHRGQFCCCNTLLLPDANQPQLICIREPARPPTLSEGVSWPPNSTFTRVFRSSRAFFATLIVEKRVHFFAMFPIRLRRMGDIAKKSVNLDTRHYAPSV